MKRDANLFSLKYSDKMHKKVWLKAVPGEVQNGHKEALGEGGQTLQTSLRNWSMPKATRNIWITLLTTSTFGHE